MTDARAVLAAVSLFATASDETLDELAAAATTRTFDSGETIVREGEVGNELFVLLSGTARVVAGGRPRRDLPAGQAFGEVSLIDGGPRSASIFAADEVEVLTLATDDVRRIIAADPERSWALAVALADRLRHLDEDRWTEKEQERLRALQRNFLANISHELRTPLTVAIGSVALLPKKADDPDMVLRIAEAASGGLDRLRSVVEGLVELSLAHAGATELQLSAEPLAALIDVAVHQAEVDRDRIDVRGAEGITLTVDGARISRALSALIHNGARFGPEGGTVTIEVHRRDEAVDLDVRDGGPGVPPDQRGALFDLFDQGDASATRTHGGLGIGLPLARAAAERHGGGLMLLEDAPQTTFRLRLPITAVDG